MSREAKVSSRGCFTGALDNSIGREAASAYIFAVREVGTAPKRSSCK